MDEMALYHVYPVLEGAMTSFPALLHMNTRAYSMRTAYRRTRYARWKPSRCDGSTPDGGYLASHPMSELEAMHVKYERDGSISNLVKAIRQLMATICPFLDLRQIHAASI
jgi:hypothetical protein